MLRNRNIALCILFSFLTCGLYLLYWEVTLFDDVNTASNERDTSGIGIVLLSMVTCGIYYLYWMYKMGGKINTAWQRKGRTADSNLGIMYLLLSVFGLALVAIALAQNEINRLSLEPNA